MSLRRYVLKRLLVTIPVLFGVTVITFSMVQFLPGNVVDYMLRLQPASADLRRQLYQQYHLNDPVWLRYFYWLVDAAQLDFGHSLISDRSVTTALAQRLPNTLLLGFVGFTIAVGIGIPAGIMAAYRSGEWADEASRVAALMGIATPNFWLGLILLLVFAVELSWFRVIPPADSGLLSYDMLHFIILPAITLGTASSALLMRLMRSSMLEEINKDYVRTARAKGLSERTVILKHVLRNSLISVVTVMALQIAFLVDGAVVVEQVFSWPGVGRLIVSAITQRDFPIIQASVLLIAVTIVFANLFVDIVYSWLDPRIRYE